MIFFQKPTAKRPYWHVDAKWIFGILFTLVLIVTVFLYSLAYLTSEKVAIPLATVVIASLFSPEGLDYEGDIEEIKKEVMLSSDKIIYPLQGQSVFITREDLENLSVRELRLKIFQQIVEPYYLYGIDHVAQIATDDLEEQEAIKREAVMFSFFNRETHSFIYRIFLVSLIPLIISLIGFVYFSHRWGKFVSPGLVLVIVAFFPSLLLLISNISVSDPNPEGRISVLLIEVIPIISHSLGLIYWSVLTLGCLLLGMAGIGKLWMTVKGSEIQPKAKK